MSVNQTRLLLIDDTPASLKLLSMMVANAGWEFDTAVDGEDALNKIKARTPDYYSVVVSDWLMPKMDGIALLKALKKDSERRQIPVILQTALADKESVQQGLREGAFYYLAKPLDMELVQSVIRSALRDYKTHQNLRAEINKITASFATAKHAEFEYKTLEEARGLSSLLASLCAEPDEAVVGLFELMVNAVEHGNLAITYDEKTQLINEGRLIDEVQQRLADDTYRDKVVALTLDVRAAEIDVTIRDMGEGFDFEQYLNFSLERMLDNHGRGIMMANQAGFKKLEYSDGGRQVSCCIDRAAFTHLSS
ncbi:response regulator [Thiomicrospira pelophila]|uniref:response regulator n=1 Tax=Thiomicrospira pelophila TaxID=934 RepID=UPI0004A74FFF|nr:response regulator [Thiomicrospira pelophila]